MRQGGLAVQRCAPGIVSRCKPSIVRDVFAHGLRTIHRNIGEWPVLIVLRHQCLAGLLKMRKIFLRPPIVQTAFGVKGGALIVECVADLVTDHGPDCAIVERVIGSGIKEGPLQNRRRKIQCILQRKIDGVNRLRRH